MWLGGASCLTQDVAVHGHVTHMGELEPHPGHLLANDVQVFLAERIVLGEEYKPSSVTKPFGYRNALQQNELMRYLHHDAGSVAGSTIGTLRATVLHILKQGERTIDKLVCLSPTETHHQAYSAGIMLVFGVI